jgi:hypothetical protein
MRITPTTTAAGLVPNRSSSAVMVVLRRSHRRRGRHLCWSSDMVSPFRAGSSARPATLSSPAAGGHGLAAKLAMRAS